jgi:hypothetical protein
VRAPMQFHGALASSRLFAMVSLVARLPVSAARSRAASCARPAHRCRRFPSACAHAFGIAAGSCWILSVGKTEGAGAWADKFLAVLMSSLPNTSRCFGIAAGSCWILTAGKTGGAGAWADKFWAVLMSLVAENQPLLCIAAVQTFQRVIFKPGHQCAVTRRNPHRFSALITRRASTPYPNPRG